MAPSAAAQQGVLAVDTVYRKLGEVNLIVTWSWSPWGGRIRAEYGPTASYGAATEWTARRGYPFSGTSELLLTRLEPGGSIHYRLRLEPTGGPSGQQPVVTDDAVLKVLESEVAICTHNCPDRDARCRAACATDPSWFEKALAACVARCRSDDPDCATICQNDLDYVSNPAAMVPVAASQPCPAGWSLHHIFVRMNFTCQQVETCGANQSFQAQADTVCTQPTERPQEYRSRVLTEYICKTRRGGGLPDRAVAGYWHQPKDGSWECSGYAYGECRVLCPK
jgi:hypothetical protein